MLTLRSAFVLGMLCILGGAAGLCLGQGVPNQRLNSSCVLKMCEGTAWGYGLDLCITTAPGQGYVCWSPANESCLENQGQYGTLRCNGRTEETNEPCSIERDQCA